MKLDRAARLQQAKAIGWTAYRLVRAAKIEGYIEIDDGRKLVRGPATAAGVPPGFKDSPILQKPFELRALDAAIDRAARS